MRVPPAGQGEKPAPLDEGSPAALQFEWLSFDQLGAGRLYEVLRFRQAIFVVEQNCAYPDLDGRDQAAEHLLATINAELAGYLRLIPYPNEARIAIGRVAVGKQWRRRGVARRMMIGALARCAQAHAGRRVVLTAQTYLVAFYESLGFRVTSAPFDDFGLMHVEMERADG